MNFQDSLYLLLMSAIHCISAVDCGDPGANVTISGEEYVTNSGPATTIYLSSTTVKCLFGYMWPDKSPSKTITCEATSFWTEIPFCLGIQLHLNIK